MSSSQVLRKIAEREMEDNKTIKELRMKAAHTISNVPVHNDNDFNSGGDGEDEGGEERKATEDDPQQEGQEELNASELQEETLVEDACSSDKLDGESEAQEESKEKVTITE